MRDAVEALVDLMIQKLFGRRQQVDRHQPFGQAADHLVAVAADRRQLDEIVEQGERLDGRHGVRLAAEEQVVERAAHVVLGVARELGAGKIDRRHAQHVQALAPMLFGEIERAELAERS